MKTRLLRHFLSLLWRLISLLYWSPPFLWLARMVPRSPNQRFTVKIRKWTLVANSVDRRLALLFWKYGVLSGDEISLIRRFVRNGMVVADIGANLGYFSLIMSDLVGSEGRVYAFEPDPANFDLLGENIERNGIKNIIPVQMAVSDTTGQSPLYLSRENRGDHRLFISEKNGRDSTLVSTTTLDDFFGDADRVDFIKIDVQGGEYRALAGARRFVATRPDTVILSEFSPKLLTDAGHQPNEFLALAGQLDFNVLAVGRRGDELKPFSYVSKNGKRFGEDVVNVVLKRRSSNENSR